MKPKVISAIATIIVVFFVSIAPVLGAFGIFQVASTTTSTSGSFPDATSAVDINFQTNQIYDASSTCTTIANCITASNNGGYVRSSSDTWTLKSSNTLRMSDLGLLTEHATSSLATATRDLTNAAWTKTNMSAAKTATGIDGSANAASTLTATAGNGTVCQSITTSSSAILTVFIKRRTGTGEIDLSVNGGTNWTAVDTTGYALMNVQRTLDSTYQPVQLLNYASNPSICLRIVTSGDAVDVDFFDLQTQTQFGQSYAYFWTSPVQTAGTTRNQDALTAASSLLTALRGSAVTVVIYVNGMKDAVSPNIWNGPNNVTPDKTATHVCLICDDTNSNWIFQAGSPFEAKTTVNNTSIVGSGAHPGFGPSYPGQDVNNPSYPVETNAGVGGWQEPGILCFSSNASGSSFTFSGGTVLNGPQISFSSTINLFRNYSAYIQRVTVYASRFSDAALQAKCNVTPTRPTLPDQAVAGSQYYTDYTTSGEQGFAQVDAQGSASPSLGGGWYGAETGQIGAPGGVSGTWNYIRQYNDHQMTRFGIIPGSPPGLGISNPSVTERVEGNGEFVDAPAHNPAGQHYSNGQTVWLAYAFWLGPGNQILSHDFHVLGQTLHWTNVPGSSLLAAIAIQGKPDTFQWQSDLTGNSYGPALQIKRNCWNFVVQKMVLSNTATGTWQIWWNGTSIFNQTGIITSSTGNPGKAKLGHYRAISSEAQYSFWANFRVCAQGSDCTTKEGTSDLSGKVASPDAIPAGYSNSSAPTCSWIGLFAVGLVRRRKAANDNARFKASA